MERATYYKSIFEFVVTFHQTTPRNHTYFYIPLCKIIKLATRDRSVSKMVRPLLDAAQIGWPADADSSELVKLAVTLKQLTESYNEQATFEGEDINALSQVAILALQPKWTDDIKTHLETEGLEETLIQGALALLEEFSSAALIINNTNEARNILSISFKACAETKHALTTFFRDQNENITEDNIESSQAELTAEWNTVCQHLAAFNDCSDEITPITLAR